MKSSTICQEWLDSLPLTEGYLKNEQSIGREFHLEKGMPSKKDEAWRLSNFNKLNSFLSLPTIIESNGIKSVFPEKDENRERIIINPCENPILNIDLPNGIALSPDEKTLYVNKMAVIDGSRKILKINLENMEISTLFDGANLPQEDEGNFDGMKVHSSGNIFTSGPGGLLIISPSGELLGKIDFGPITNCAFDDKEEYLYATGFVNNPKVYRIKLKNNS